MISFENFFKDISRKRYFEIEKSLANSVANYQETVSLIINTQKKIIEQLPQSSKELLYKYEELELWTRTIVQEHIYEQGFKDGAAFHEYIHSRT